MSTDSSTATRPLKDEAFYWVKLKPFSDSRVPGWEPLQHYGGKWHRAGVIYRFSEHEFEEVGAEITAPDCPVRCPLTPEQISALRCARADLQGVLQCRDQLDFSTHDWKAHELSIRELEEAFPEALEEQ
jgi:hypothetical protein